MQGQGQKTALESDGHRRMKILLVDDTPENLVALEAALSGLGEELVLAHSGKEALRRLLEDDFSAILLDVRMPDMDGFETAQLIRSRPRSRQVPILFLTGFRNEEHLFRGYNLGAVDFLFKPIVPEVLRSKVAVFVELSRINAKLVEQADTLRKQAEILEKAGLKFRSLLEGAPDAMVVMNSSGQIVLVNARAEKLFGYSREELLGNTLERIAPECFAADNRKAFFGDAAAGSGGAGLELCGRRKDGVEFPAEISASPLETEEGTLISITIRDISERKKAEEQIRQLNASLEERVMERTEALARSNEELQQFAYVASHDLQEPLRTVSLYAQLLAARCRSQVQAQGEQYIDCIVDNAGRMEKLIHDLLDFSRVDARDTNFFTRMHCGQALEDALGNLRTLIEESGAVVTYDAMPWITGDPGQITRLFQNLLVNSIKYRGDEVPRVHIGVIADGGEWRFSVRDNGIGIDAQYADKVFGIFRGLHPRGKFSGSGIGLAICRKVMERHRGRIWVEATEGPGTTVCFSLAKTE